MEAAGAHRHGPNNASLTLCDFMGACLVVSVGTADGLTKPADDALLEVRQQPAASREQHQCLQLPMSTDPAQAV